MSLPVLDLTHVVTGLLGYLLAMLRLGAFVISAPVFAARFVPLPVRIVIAASLALAALPYIEVVDVSGLSPLTWTGIVLIEIAIGLAVGLVLQIMFAAAMLAGDWISATAGMAFAAQIDPATGAQTPVIAQLLFLLLLCAFLAVDGHLTVIGLLIDSYRYLPIGGPISTEAMIAAGPMAAGHMYRLAAQFMLPVVAILLIVNLVIGVITRSAPQMNIFSFGFPLMLMAALGLLFVMIPAIGAQFYALIPDSLGFVQDLLRASAPNG